MVLHYYIDKMRRFLLVEAEPAHKINICGGGLEYSTMI